MTQSDEKLFMHQKFDHRNNKINEKIERKL